MLKALKKGEAVGMPLDQAPKVGEGRWIDFGKPAGLHDDLGRASLREWGDGAHGLGGAFARRGGVSLSL